MKTVKDYTIEELNLAWNETMWEIDTLREAIADRMLPDRLIRQREEDLSRYQQRIAELNQEYIRRGIDAPESD